MDKEIFSFNEEAISDRIVTILDKLGKNDTDYQNAEDNLYNSMMELSRWANKEIDDSKTFEKIFDNYIENSHTIHNMRMRAVYANAIFDCIAMLKKHKYI